MKKQFKLFTLLLISLTFGVAYAQLPNGSIAPDFTVSDIDGNSYRLYDLLDSGYTVVIDLNATWCGPCWSYHEGGELETLWEEHGPAGATGVSANTTDDVFVMMIESESSNSIDQIYGTTGNSGDAYADNTYGDWTIGTNFPIVDDASVASAYGLTYFPTIFTICPNRTLTLSGQISADAHYSIVQECPPVVEGINVAVLSMESNLESEGCTNSASGNIEVTIQNLGTIDSLGSISIAVVADGDTLAVEDFDASNLNQFSTYEGIS